MGSAYTCDITTNLYIKSPEDAVIVGVSGTHLSGKTNDDVTAFYAYNKSIEYFPKRLERFFGNLKVILIKYGQLKEISQSDLKPFSSLVYLNLHFNDIEILEDGLFDSHRNMQVIWFGVNKVFHVGKNVFNNLNKITYLGFGANQCIDMDTWDNSTAVNLIIESLRLKCFDVNFSNFSHNLENLENESKILSFENFQNWGEKLQKLENEFKSSRFSYLTSINARLQVLKTIKSENFPDVLLSKLENTQSTITKSLTQTEHNLTASITETCTDVNYQTLYLMKDEFTKINEKLHEHSSEVRTQLIKSEVQHASILTDISYLKAKMEILEEKLDKILNAI